MSSSVRDASWNVGFRRGKAGRAYSCPWWADERVYGLALLQGKGMEIPRHPHDSRKPADESWM